LFSGDVLKRRIVSKLRWILCLSLALFAGCAQKPSAPPGANVIPAPHEIVPGEGAFVVEPTTPVTFDTNSEIERIAGYFATLVSRTGGPQLDVVSASTHTTRPDIRFQLAASGGVPDAEGYSLRVSPQRIVISAGTPRGLFYGAVTLWQLITPQAGDRHHIRIAALTINDRPRFAWRGLLLDVARHYMEPDRVKQMIDWMALHKLNVLHWHLTDDQGWRLEIRKYPKLTGVGAWRVPAGAAGVDAGGKPVRYGGFYTQEEVRDIVRYASERYITVVPGIEMPGHAQAAIAAYPELGSRGDHPAVSHDWGIHTYLFNVEDDTFAFLENVLSEVLELFPSPYIHVGGDEAVKDQWQGSAQVQKRMREHGIASEAQLQGYFVARIGTFLSAHGRRLVGWDEILEGGVPADAVVMSWRGVSGGREAARLGHDVVMAPSPELYLDHLQSDSSDEPPGRAGIESVAEVYAFNPVPAELGEEQARHIIGVQANLWTEHVRTSERVEHAVFPRLAALAEIAWSAPAQRNWASFAKRLPAQLERYRALGIRFADSAFAVRFAPQFALSRNAARLQLSTQTHLGEIRYTLDGSEPTPQSTLYAAPIEGTLPLRVRAASFAGAVHLARARDSDLTAQNWRMRRNEQLKLCHEKLPLRLEDDAPAEGERAVFLIDIMDPCWIYVQAPLDGVTRIEATVGQLPYNFQLWKDTAKIVTHAPASDSGELHVRLDSCDGPLVASLSLSPAQHQAALSKLSATLAPRSGAHDLCLLFTSKSHDPLWAIESINLN
jgi:hexosaminidase